MKTCYIFGAADGLPEHFVRKESDIVIGADAGYQTLEKLGIQPDIVLGDFDSLGYVPDFNGEIIRHPVKKDDTDTLLAVKLGFKKGYKRFIIFGGTGKRLDHTMANIQTLAYISNNGGIGFLCGEDFTVTVINNSSLRFKSSANGNISLFSLVGESSGVDVKGLLYELNDGVITNNYPIGTSNEFVGKESEITVKNGTLAIIWSGKTDDLI